MGSLAGVLLVVGIAAAVASLVVLHVLPTGVSALAGTVSEYGLGRFRAGYAIAAFGAAAAAVGAALALQALTGLSTALPPLWIFAIARALIPFFPAEENRRQGRIGAHTVLALVAFAAVMASALLSAGPLHDAGHTAAAIASTLCGFAMMVGLVCVLASPYGGLRRVVGVFERLIYLGFLVWFAVIAAAAIAG